MSEPVRLGEGGCSSVTIVGHGPSILSGRGVVIDESVVVRLKEGLTQQQRKTQAIHWGTRTDYLCARSPVFEQKGIGFLLFADHGEMTDRWMRYFHSFEPRIAMKPRIPKPSSGMCAVFCVAEYLKPGVIALIGFDRMLNPNDTTSGKWHAPRASCWPHDSAAEHRALYGLGIPITNLAQNHG